MRKALLHVILPVVVGAAIYVVWRVPTLRVFEWANAVGLGGVISTFRVFALQGGIRPPRIVLFTLPDGLWVYSLTADSATCPSRIPCQAATGS